MLQTIILIACILLQFSCLAVGIYVLRGTFWRRVWLVINILLVAIGFRRSFLIALSIYHQTLPPDAIMTEVIALLLLALILLTGSILIYLMFRSIEQKEAVLIESEQRFRRIVENTFAGYFYCDREGNFQHVNKAWLHMHGYESESEVIGKHFSLVLADESYSEADRQFYARLLSGKAVPTGESICRRKDGSAGYHIFSAHPVLKEGEVIGFEGFLIDVTENKQAEQKLRESEEKYHALFEGSRDALMIMDVPSQLFAAGNSSTLEMFRMNNEEEFIAYAPWDLSPEYQPDGRPSKEKGQEMIDRVLREGSHFFEWTHKRKDGETFMATVLLTKIMTGGQTMLQATVRDVTEQKKAETALRDSEERFNQLAAASHTITWEVDAVGLCTYMSDVVEAVLGYRPEELVGKKHCYDLAATEEGVDTKSRNLDMLSSKQPFLNLENQMVHKDGHIVWLVSSGIPILDQDGALLGYRGMDTDISEQKRMEAEKERLHEQFIHAQKMESVGQLAGGIAHDFNNKLAIIRGYVEFALRQVVRDEPLRTCLEKIEQAANSASELTKQILAFARQQTATPQQINLNESIENLFAMVEKIIGEDIKVRWKPGDIDSAINIDPAQLDQILTNLLLNARDAIMDGGDITVETAAETIDEGYAATHLETVPGDYVVLTVSDNGCGMTKETLGHIYEPFFTTKGVGKGTGLGLSTVYGIVKQNEGFVTVYSELEQGTTFKVYLPHCGDRQGKTTVPPLEEPVTGGQETILVVEDEVDLLDLCQIMLESLGYHILAANSPEEALRLAAEYDGEIHLLMTDVVMPAMNGRALAQELHSHYPHINVLFMSGYTSDTIVHHGVLDDDVNFIQKPFSTDQLAAKVRSTLRKA